MDTFLLCVMVTRLSELRSVLQRLIPDLIEPEMSYCIHAHGSDSQWLLSLEQSKCNSSFYPQCMQQYKKLPLTGS